MTSIVAVGFGDALNLKNVLAGRALHFKLDERAGDVGPRQLRHLQPLNFFSSRLHLAAARSGGKALDKLIQLRNLFLALRVLAFNLRAPER